MTNKVLQFVSENVNKLGLVDKKCLDIGSLDVNGSVRSIFNDYIGLDMRKGNNVDIVCNAHNLPFNEEFSVITCLEMLEHDNNPFETLKQIRKSLKSGGYVILCASGISFPRHDYPSDYFRYTEDGLKALMDGFDVITAISDDDEAYAVGIKK